ncbi:hypothetical protein ACFJGW_15410 [Burkholderiaceae bacterium UC74_6]
MTAREIYVENMKLELDKLNDKLESLEDKAVHALREGRENYEAELTKLRGHSRDALSKWGELNAASEASWHQWTTDMDRLRDALVHSFHEVKARI